MSKYAEMMATVLAYYLQTKKYPKVWDVLVVSKAVSPLLFDRVSQESLIDFLAFYGPTQADDVVEGDLEQICTNMLRPAYQKGYYRLCAYIYGMGYELPSDPLCGNRHPLAFGAEEGNLDFLLAYLKEQERFDYLSFDSERACRDGAIRTLPEDIVETGNPEAILLCLKAGLSPNAFSFRGNKLLDLSPNDTVRRLLLSWGATAATPAERNMVRVVNQLRRNRLTDDSVEALLSTEPLMHLQWRNGNTRCSKQQSADLYMEAALCCCPELLEKLYPYAREALEQDLERSHELLEAVLSLHYDIPFKRVTRIYPMDIIGALDGLYRAGFRYRHPQPADAMTAFLEDLCHRFSFWMLVTVEEQVQIFTKLWHICGAPSGQAFWDTLSDLVGKVIAEDEYPHLDEFNAATALELFIKKQTHCLRRN